VQVDSAKVKDDASKYRPFMVDFLLPESDRDHVRFNVPVVYMARDEMILMGANHFEGHWALQITRVPVMDLYPSKSLSPRAI
jgi:hypothetical protein